MSNLIVVVWIVRYKKNKNKW